MYTIQTNASGTRTKDLLDLCLDVIYHDNMKAFGLHQLIMLYIKWEREKGNIEEETEEEA